MNILRSSSANNLWILVITKLVTRSYSSSGLELLRVSYLCEGEPSTFIWKEGCFKKYLQNSSLLLYKNNIQFIVHYCGLVGVLAIYHYDSPTQTNILTTFVIQCIPTGNDIQTGSKHTHTLKTYTHSYPRDWRTAFIKQVLPRFLRPAQWSWQVSPLANLMTLGGVTRTLVDFDLHPTCLLYGREKPRANMVTMTISHKQPIW